MTSDQSENSDSVVSTSQIKVRLVVTSYVLTPKQMTDCLGNSGSKTWKLGDRVHQAATNRFAHNGWVLSSTAIGDNLSTEEMLRKLENDFDFLKVNALRKLDDQCSVELSLVVHAGENVPEVHLSSSQLRLLADIGAEVDVDIYPWGVDSK